jgi:hypothetical protein
MQASDATSRFICFLALCRVVDSISVRALQKTLKDRGIYPARDFAHRCEPIPPDSFFTYHSAENFVDIQEIVWRAFDFAAQQFRARHPDLDEVDFEPMIADGIRLWVDFVFIDQGARDIRRELDVLPLLLNGAQAHFVLGEQPLSRAWCCYEIALFNQRCATATAQGLPLRSFIAPTTSLYFGWESTETTEAEDKAFIEDHIRSRFPNGFEGFDQVMHQANATAVLSKTESAPSYPPAALDSLAKAAELWFTRALPK